MLAVIIAVLLSILWNHTKPPQQEEEEVPPLNEQEAKQSDVPVTTATASLMELLMAAEALLTSRELGFAIPITHWATTLVWDSTLAD